MECLYCPKCKLDADGFMEYCEDYDYCQQKHFELVECVKCGYTFPSNKPVSDYVLCPRCASDKDGKFLSTNLPEY